MKDEVIKEQVPAVIGISDATDLAKSFSEETGLDPILSKIEKEVLKQVPDVSTAKGRKEIASLAHKVARSKTAIDQAGQALTEEARKQVEKVNMQRKASRERLDALKATVRKPLDDWEAEDKKRRAALEGRMKAFDAKRTHFSMSVAEITAIIEEVEAIEVGEDWEELESIARENKENALTSHRSDLGAAQVREDQEAKIKQLEAEAAERKAAEAAERAKAEEQARIDQEKQDAIQREEAEKQRIADAVEKLAAEQSAHADRLIKHAQECGEGFIGGQPQPIGILEYELTKKIPDEAPKVGDHWPRVQEAINAALMKMEAFRKQLDEEQALKKAEAEKAREEEHAAALKAKEEAHQKELERAAEAERERLAQKEQKAEEARAKRAADEKHRTRVLTTVTKALAAFPTEELAHAILDGKIPHVKLEL